MKTGPPSNENDERVDRSSWPWWIRLSAAGVRDRTLALLLTSFVGGLCVAQVAIAILFWSRPRIMDLVLGAAAVSAICTSCSWLTIHWIDRNGRWG